MRAKRKTCGSTAIIVELAALSLLSPSDAAGTYSFPMPSTPRPTVAPARPFWQIAAAAAGGASLHGHAEARSSDSRRLGFPAPGKTFQRPRGLPRSSLLHRLVPHPDLHVQFPPGALPPFVVPQAIDGDHHYLLFKLLMAFCGAVTLVLGARVLAALGATRRRYLRLAPFALLPLLLGHVYLNRYDAWPALLLVATLLLLLLRRESGAFGVVGLAVAAKLFPAAALPVAAVRTLRERGRRGLLWATATFTSALLVAFAPFAAIAPGGLGYSLKSQAERHLQIRKHRRVDPVGAGSDRSPRQPLDLRRTGLIHLGPSSPDIVGVLSSIAQVAAVALVALLYWRGKENDERLVTAFAAAVTVTALGKVLSPQYLTMLTAVVPLALACSGRRATILLVIALVGTEILITWNGYEDLRNAGWSVLILLGRNGCLVALFGILIMSLHKSTDRRSPQGTFACRGVRGFPPTGRVPTRSSKSATTSSSARSSRSAGRKVPSAIPSSMTWFSHGSAAP